MAKINYFLDTRKVNLEGKYSLVLNVSHRTMTTRIPMGHHFTKEEWNQIYLSIRNDKPCNWNRITEDLASLKNTYDVALNTNESAKGDDTTWNLFFDAEKIRGRKIIMVDDITTRGMSFV